jgi:hypothetical protein
MFTINYQKRKNKELLEALEQKDMLFLSKTQNYIPIYTRFFTLNETNYLNVNLNNPWYLLNVKENIPDNEYLYSCAIKNTFTNKIKTDTLVFFKLAPLLDPYKYLIGKYNSPETELFNLPNLQSTIKTVNPKFLDVNNSAYVDSFFVFLSGILKNSYFFLHGIDYYGSFLSIKNNYKINVTDDIDFLSESDYFIKQQNILFNINNPDYLLPNKKIPIMIDYTSSLKSNFSIKSIDDELFENVFEKTHIDLNDVKSYTLDLCDITNSKLITEKDKTTTLKTSSTFSSRSSHTSSTISEEHKLNNLDTDPVDNESDENICKEDDDAESTTDNTGSSESSGEDVEVTIYKFPVLVICMEQIENTFDDYILNNDLTEEEWFAYLMQIIMILITYQKVFSLTHNDLHTNNVMYNNTTIKYLYYCYNKKYYKVPTFGKIFKIIDFGRSIYKFNNKIFCSDSFNTNGDASTQYNTEPYFNENKPRLEPNFSFDLCRLACSIFDYVVDDIYEIKDLTKCDPIVKLIVEWCLDDRGVNLLYKNNGMERYPDFKLYKMIARHVHNHTPQAQLERTEFSSFSISNKKIPKNETIFNIDALPILI